MDIVGVGVVRATAGSDVVGASVELDGVELEGVVELDEVELDEVELVVVVVATADGIGARHFCRRKRSWYMANGSAGTASSLPEVYSRQRPLLADRANDWQCTLCRHLSAHAASDSVPWKDRATYLLRPRWSLIGGLK